MSDPVYRMELTPVSFLRRSAAVFPDKVAVVHGQRRYSYRELHERVNRLASRLRAAGLDRKRHDRVAFLCPNTPALLEAHFAVPAAGGILAAINTRLSSAEIGYILSHSGAQFLFVDAESEHLIQPLDTTGIAVVRIEDTGAPGDPYEDYLASGDSEPVESHAQAPRPKRQRGGGHCLLPRAPGALQMPGGGRVRRAAQNVHRQGAKSCPP